MIETCPPYETFGQISGLKVFDEQTHFFSWNGVTQQSEEAQKIGNIFYVCVLMYSLKQFECPKNEAERNFVLMVFWV